MFERTYCGKKTNVQQDPLVGQAALANAETAKAAVASGDAAQQFSQDYYTNHVAPLLEQQVAESQATQARLNSQFDYEKGLSEQYLGLQREQYGMQKEAQAKVNALNDASLEQMKLAQQRYTEYGIPAENRYYDMVSEYSAPVFAEQQAGLALGDQRVGAQNQRQTMSRQMSAAGINASSPAAISAMADMAVMNAAQEASAQNRARGAAQALGMQLKSDAANFGRGGQSAVLAFGQQAQQGAQSSAGLAAQSAQAYAGLGQQASGSASQNAMYGNSVGSGMFANINQGAGVPMAGYGMQQQGYGTALQGYGSNMNAGLQLTKMRQEAQTASDEGFGKFLGTAVGVGASFYKSDRRLKRDVVPRGTLPSGLPLYDFYYIDEAYGPVDVKHIGVMADEAIQWFPDAVREGADGYLEVDYTKLR